MNSLHDQRGTTAKLVSVNVGMPADVAWRGKTVYTGIYKTPVAGTGDGAETEHRR